MNKRFLIWFISIVLIVISIVIIYRLINSRNQEISLNENSQNLVDISQTQEGEVTDECINEWEDYNKYMGERVQSASSNSSENDTHYLLKDVLGYIEVYYLENNKEYLYKKTTIPTAYLSQEDIEDLKVGIEVVGAEELNKMLEDFE